MEQQQSFFIKYSGESLDNGYMDIDIFIKSLGGLNNLLNQSSKLIFNKEVSHKIKKVKEGSIILEIIANFDIAVDLLNNNYITAAFNFGELLFFGKHSISALLKLIKKRNIVKIIHKDNEYSIILDDGDIISGLNEEVVSLLKDNLIRYYMKEFVSPLNEADIEELSFSRDDINYSESIKKSEVIYYDNLLERRVVSDENHEFKYNIENLSFNRNRKWKLFDIDNKVPRDIKIEDESLYSDIENKHRKFAKSDILTCDVRVIERVENDGRTSYEYIIEKVKKHSTVNINEEYQLEIFKE